MRETSSLTEEKERFNKDLAGMVHAALTEDWRASKSATAVALVQSKYSTAVQVVNMVKAWEAHA